MSNTEEPLLRPVNLRDLGGIPSTRGRRVLPQRLVRSGEVVGLTDSESNQLTTGYKVTHIVDMRTESERLIRPDDIFPGVTNTPLDVLTDALGAEDEKAPTRENLMTMLDDVNTVQNFMLDVYARLITAPTAQQGYREFIDILLSESKSATLVHCQAGKDRTGVAIMIALHILGVSDDNILTDYLVTNTQRAAANHKILSDMKAQGMDKNQLAALTIALQVDRAYLLHAVDVATTTFGSFDGYIREGLNVTPDEITELRATYLSDS